MIFFADVSEMMFAACIRNAMFITSEMLDIFVSAISWSLVSVEMSRILR
jgi:hypothetical protein